MNLKQLRTLSAKIKDAEAAMLKALEQEFPIGTTVRAYIQNGQCRPSSEAYRQETAALDAASSHERSNDEARLLWLETLLKHCPHAELTYNDDADEGPVGFSLRVEGCATLDLKAPTLDGLIDLVMKAEADEDGNVIASAPASATRRSE